MINIHEIIHTLGMVSRGTKDFVTLSESSTSSLPTPPYPKVISVVSQSNMFRM